MANQWQSNPMSDAISEIEQIPKYQTKKESDIPPFHVNPKNIKSRIGELSVQVSLKRHLFVTDGTVEGQLTIKCLKENSCKLGKILIHLIGIEELTSKRKPIVRTFLSKTWIVQDQRLVPSDAVYAGSPDTHGMWKARAGVTVFDFAIPFLKTEVGHIQSDIDTDFPLPSSYWNSQIGGIRYIVAGVVESKQGDEPRYPLASYKQLRVIESLPFTLTNLFDGQSPMNSALFVEKTEAIKTGIFGMGKKGKVTLNASLRTLSIDGPNETGVWTSGSIGFVGIEIINNCSKRLVRLDVSLIRIIKTFKYADGEFSPNSYAKSRISTTNYIYAKEQISSGQYIHHFKPTEQILETKQGKFEIAYLETIEWDGVRYQDKKKMIVELNIPPFANTIRYGSLVDVSFAVNIKIWTKHQSKIEVEMPIAIFHPASFLAKVPPLVLDDLSPYDMAVTRYEIAESERSYTPISDHTTSEVLQYDSTATLESYRSLSIQRSKYASINSRVFISDKYKNTRPPVLKPSPAFNITKKNGIIQQQRELYSHQTDFDLRNTPTVDLSNELDKLNQVVEVE